MPHTSKIIALLAALALLAPAAAAEPVHGIAMHGEPKHPAGFPHFPYVNPDAPKGGQLVLGALGTFDSLNPFIIRGVTPSGLRHYVYESLLARMGRAGCRNRSPAEMARALAAGAPTATALGAVAKELHLGCPFVYVANETVAGSCGRPNEAFR
jgi:hypothetical protein